MPSICWMPATRSRSPSGSASFCVCARSRAAVAEAYRDSREALGFPLLKRPGRPRGGEPDGAARPAVRAAARRNCRRARCASLSSALTEGLVKGLERRHRARAGARFRHAAPSRRAGRRPAPRVAPPTGSVERRGPPREPMPSMRRARPPRPPSPSPGIAAWRWRQLERLVTDKGAWLVFRGTERGAATVQPARRDHRRRRSPALPIAKRMRWGSAQRRSS